MVYKVGKTKALEAMNLQDTDKHVHNGQGIHLTTSFEELEKQLDKEESFLRSFESKSGPIKILLSVYKGNYARILLSVLFYTLKYIPVILKPIFTAELINLAVNAVIDKAQPDWATMLAYFFGMIILTALNVPFNYVQTKFYSMAIRSVEAKLRSSMVRKLQHLSIGFHKEMQSGRIQSKIMRDVEAIEGMSQQLFTSFVAIIFSLVTALVITASKSLSVFALFLVLVPVAVLLITVFRKNIRRRNTEFRSEVETTSAVVMEMVELIPVTKAHALEDIETAKMNTQLVKMASRGHALDMIQSVFASFNWASFELFQLLCLGFTVMLAFKGSIEIGDISLYQSYFSSIVSNICSVINLVPILTKGFESVKSVGDILGAYDVEDNEGKIKLESLEGEYEFSGVTFGYRNAVSEQTELVIKGLDLKIKKGETIALVGESGSGKSTVLNLVIGFYKPFEGKLTVDGMDINDIDLRSYRKHIAVVPQTSILFSGTIKDNITYGNPDVSDEELWDAIKAANLYDMIRNMPQGLKTQVGEHGDKLSGGQRQRVSIARAIIRKPDVIVFDEATSALDSVSEKLIQDAIDNLCRDKTTFIVAHRLSTIRNADKIAVISKGVCVEYGTYEELMEKKGEFYKYKSLQS